MIAIFLFYNQSSGKQASLAFNDEFKHCNIITFDGDAWVCYELDTKGVHTRILKVKDAGRLVINLRAIKALTAMVVVWVAERKSFAWFPWWVRSCNEFNRYISGVDIGFTFNPVHLYNKLLEYNVRTNYEILTEWRRNGLVRQ